MILVLDGGRSFKGAAAYYLHDKREKGEAERLTSERVAWTETVNLPTADPEKAWRMMAHTAMAQAELKKAAGVKATGRKLAKPVSTLVVSWKEEDAPTRAEQLDAARDLLRVLEVDDRQALIVAHNDTKHPHLHILINRVSPETGIAAELSKSKEKLQAWARTYQKARGQTHCPKREEKAAAKARGEKVEPTGRISRPVFEFTRAVANSPIRASFVRSEQQQKDAALYAQRRAMKESHRRQWEAVRRIYAEAKAALTGQGDAQRSHATARAYEAHRPDWTALLIRQQREELQFAARERSPLGRALNMAEAIRAEGWQAGGAKGILGALFNAKGGQARAAMEERHQQERDELEGKVSAAMNKAAVRATRATRADLTRLRGEYLSRCETLHQAQEQERAGHSQAWDVRNAERADAFAPIEDRAAAWDRVRDIGENSRAWERDGFQANDLSRKPDGPD